MTNEETVKMEVRGKALVPMPKFVIKKFGKEGYDKWLDAISAEAHTVFILPIKQNDWYPLKKTFIEPCANIAQLFYGWDLEKAAWELGRFSADYGLKHVYRLFVKVGPSHLFIEKAGEFMSSYYRPSAMEVVKNEKSSGVFRITKFPEIDKSVEYRIAGWVQRSLEINGCKNVNIEIPRSLVDSHPYTEFRITWE